MITQDTLKTLFDYDVNTGDFIAKTPQYKKKVGCVDSNGYKCLQIQGKKYYLHRMVYLYHFGELPAKLDHIDRNPTNSRIENLRPATSSQNSANSSRHKDNKSGHKGVGWFAPKSAYRARIVVNGKHKFLGYFKEFKAACTAYQVAASQYFGQFAEQVSQSPEAQEI